MSPLDDRFDAALAEIDERRAQERARSGLWLAHHWPDEYDRCVVIAGRHVCRRCLALYPSAWLTSVGFLAGLTLWPSRLDLWVIWGLCLPATVDFLAEQLGLLRFSARRQLAVTLLLGPGLGAGFAHEIDDPWSWEFWGPVLVFCAIWFFVALAGRRRRETTGS